MYILGIDVGTSSVKAAVLTVEAGETVGDITRVDLELDMPSPEAAELRPDLVWRAVAEAGRTAVQKAAVAGTAQEIRGVGLSCLMPALVLLDDADQPLQPIWTHLDRRARPAARQVWGAVGPEFLATIGNRPLPGGISALCFRQIITQSPYLLHDIRDYLHLNGWLGLHMTGERFFDTANASFTGLWGTVTDQQWSRRWCDYFEVDPAWLPPVVSGDRTIGTIRSAIAAELGVPAGIPVKIGTADTSSAILAARLEPGQLMHVVGTTQVLAGVTDRPVPAATRLTRLLGVGTPYLHVTHNPVGGVALDWIHQLCFRDQSTAEFFEKTIPSVRERKTRVSFDPPFLGGDRLEIEACRASFRDLELGSDRLDLLAALVQAMINRHREAVRNLGLGERFSRIVLSGGGGALVRRLLPEYQTARVDSIHEGSLRGIAQLFQVR